MWEIAAYKEFPAMSEETTAYRAILTYGVLLVADVSNDGHGGCTIFRPVCSESREYIRRFRDFCRVWADENGGGGIIEPEDLFIDWYVHGRKNGETAQQFFGAYNAILKEWGVK